MVFASNQHYKCYDGILNEEDLSNDILKGIECSTL